MRLILIQSVLLMVAYGLDFEPKPENSGSHLIEYRSSDENTSAHFRNKLDDFLRPYKIPGLGGGIYDIIRCQRGEPPREGSTNFCDVDANSWRSCDSSYGYHYNSSETGPCIFLKFRKASNWTPEYYTSSTVPEDMPDYLKQKIQATEDQHGTDSNELKVVWLSCDGVNPADVENVGPIIYNPVMGFTGEYFPIRNEEHYQSPLVAVLFEKPQRGVLIKVQCKVWAKNLRHESVHFKLLINN